MKKILYLLLIQIICGCNNNDKLKDIVQSTLRFIPADTLREFNYNGDFAIINDTILISDYGYNNNDDKEISIFSLNKQAKKRFLTRMGKGYIEMNIEMNIDNNILQVFRRNYNGIYEEYDKTALTTDSAACKYRKTFAHTDHLVKAGNYFIGTDIIGSPNILNLYDKNGKLLQSLDPFNGALTDITGIGRQYAVGQGYLAYNSIDHFIVYATVYSGEIFIYDIMNNKLRLLKKINIGKGLPKNYMNFEMTENTIVYTNDICQSEHYIYILVRNATIKDKAHRSYILRINKKGDMHCMDCKEILLRIYVDKNKLYAMAQRDIERNVLVSTNLY